MLKKYVLILLVFLLMGPSVFGEVSRVWENNPFFVPRDISAVDEGVIKKTVANKIFVLQGIWKQGKLYKAMISDRIVTTGSTFDGYVIYSISADKVVLKLVETEVLEVLEINE
jgi:hypothetical protein